MKKTTVVLTCSVMNRSLSNLPSPPFCLCYKCCFVCSMIDTFFLILSTSDLCYCLSTSSCFDHFFSLRSLISQVLYHCLYSKDEDIKTSYFQTMKLD